MSRVDLTLEHCVYITRHAYGYIYAGKGKTQNVSQGKYKGSGIRLTQMFLKEGFEFDTWRTTIVRTFADAEAAFHYERVLVSMLRSNPNILNLAEGGIGGSGMTGKSHREATRYKMSMSAKKVGEDEILRSIRSVNLRAMWDNPEYRQKRLLTMRTPQAVQRRKEAALARVGWQHPKQNKRNKA